MCFSLIWQFMIKDICLTADYLILIYDYLEIIYLCLYISKEMKLNESLRTSNHDNDFIYLSYHWKKDSTVDEAYFLYL